MQDALVAASGERDRKESAVRKARVAELQADYGQRRTNGQYAMYRVRWHAHSGGSAGGAGAPSRKHWRIREWPQRRPQRMRSLAAALHEMYRAVSMEMET